MKLKTVVRGIFFVLALVTLVFLPFSAQAQNQGDSKLNLKTEGFLVKEVIEEGGEKKEVLEPLPDKVYPGDVIEYKITVENVSDSRLKNVVVRAKIPEGTVYVPGSATGNPEFSIDDGKTFSKEPIKYYVEENGQKIEKVATPDMYTNVRWKIEALKPGESIQLSYRVRVK